MSTGLSAFFAPRSVAVVGASADPAKWGYYLADGALAGADLRAVDFVNVRAEPVFGRPVHPSVTDLERVPELVVVAVPGPAVGRVVDDALAAGSRAFVVVAADVPDPAALVEKITAAGGRILGPNSLGVFDAASKVQLAAWMDLMPGALAVVTQSGQVGRDIAALARPLGLGISRFVSVGPQLDVTAQEALEELIDHEPTELVALYLEGFRRGRALVDTISKLRAAGKPTIVIAVGSSAAGRHAAMSHTGALTASLDVVDAACRAAGAVRVSTPTELVHTARLLLKRNRPGGNRLAIFSDSGGQGALAADLAMAAGLQVPEFPPAVADAVEETVIALVPHMGGTANPVDLANAGDRDMFIYSDLAAIAFDNDAADAVLITGYFGQYGADAPDLLPRELEVIKQLAAVADRTGRPILVNTPASDSPVLAAAEDRGITVFHTVDTALHALAIAATHGATHPRELSTLPAERPDPPAVAGYLAARARTEEHGISFPPAHGVNDSGELLRALASLTAPYVLKAAWLEHKTEVGGVVVGLDSADAVQAAYDDMTARLGPGTYVVEEMDDRPGVVEFIVGARRDPQFGPTVMVGAGGVHAELYRDTALELAPVDRECAAAMVARLRCAPLITGWRGSDPLDVSALVDVIVAAGDVLVECDAIEEFELNPVRLAASGAVAVDAMLTCSAVAAPDLATNLT